MQARCCGAPRLSSHLPKRIVELSAQPHDMSRTLSREALLEMLAMPELRIIAPTEPAEFAPDVPAYLACSQGGAESRDYAARARSPSASPRGSGVLRYRGSACEGQCELAPRRSARHNFVRFCGPLCAGEGHSHTPRGGASTNF